MMRNRAGRVREPDGTPESSPGHPGDLADRRSADRSDGRSGGWHRQISRLLEWGELPALLLLVSKVALRGLLRDRD